VNRIGVSTALAAGLLAFCPVAASAQARVIVAPSAAAGPVYDDNLFSAPQGQETVDVIWRVTPGISGSRETPRTFWFGNYSLDAELYRDHPSLTTPLARQTGAGSVRIQASTRSAVTFAGGYDNTITPTELNVTTGVQLGRVRGWRWHAGPEFRHDFASSSSFTVAYDLTDEALSSANPLSTGRQLMTHAGDVRVVLGVNERNEIHVGGLVRDFLFDGTRNLWSVGGLIGWGVQLTPYTKFTVLGGPRVTQGDSKPEPEVDATLLRRVRVTDVSLNYARTLTTAVGLFRPLLTQRVVGSASYRRIAIAEIGVQGGWYQNRDRQGNSTLRVYRIGGDVMRRIAGALSIAASYTYDFQRGHLRAVQVPILGGSAFVTDPTLVILPPSFIDTPLRHSTAMVRLSVSPRFRPMSKPKEGATDAHR
jgi:hypothetical protein